MPLLTLYAATTNAGKLAEFATAAQPLGLQVEALPNLATIPEPIEDADTFLGNAELKARAYSLTLPGQLIFADDSGLEVPALNNAPGVRSARYADDLHFNLPQNPFISTTLPHQPVISTEAQRSGETPVFAPTPLSAPTKDTRNNACLLDELAKLPLASRQTRFVCALALARDGQILLTAEGFCEGQLLTAPRGTHGFGYDPLFLIPHLNLTLAELDPAQKWQLSHRGNAFRALLAKLPTLAL